MSVHLVLVHGSRLSRAQWSPQLPLLDGHVSVGLVDLPGHGAREAEPFTLAGCVSAIDEAVSQAPPGSRVVVVGHSLGGFAAMSYAAGLGSRLAGLVLAGCSASPVGLGAAVYRGVAALTDRLGPDRMTRVNDRVLRRLYAPELIDPVIAGGYFFAPTAAAWAEVMSRCRPAMLAGLTCPVLVLNGQFDQFRVGARRFVRALEDAGVQDVRVEVIQRAGHISNLDQPETFAAVLLRFADSVDAL